MSEKKMKRLLMEERDKREVRGDILSSIRGKGNERESERERDWGKQCRAMRSPKRARWRERRRRRRRLLRGMTEFKSLE